MYFWNINALKVEIIKNEFSEKKILPYIIWTVLLYAVIIELLSYMPTEESGIWEYVDSILSLLIPIFGTLYVYKKNGGENGSLFAVKYFAIGFVVGIRYMFYFILLAIGLVFYWGLSGAGFDDHPLTFLELTIFSVWYILLYFSIGKHMRDTAIDRTEEELQGLEAKATSKGLSIIGVISLFLITVLLVLGIMGENGFFPSTKVESGDEVLVKDKEILISNEIITKEDKITYFYSYGVISILEGGSVLTQDRVVQYLQDENDNVDVYELYYDDIVSIELIEKGDTYSGSTYKVNAQGKDAWLELMLSTEKDGDIKFIDIIKQRSKNIKK